MGERSHTSRYGRAVVDMRNVGAVSAEDCPPPEKRPLSEAAMPTGKIIPFPKKVAVDGGPLTGSILELGYFEIALMVFTAALALACIAIAIVMAVKLGAG